jgi:HK97 gp10 family phage protein
MRVDLDISGLSKLTRQLAELSDDAEQVIRDTVTATAVETRNEAVRGIQRGPATGKIYRRRGVTHQTSAPGEYPASDTGRLANSVEFDVSQVGRTEAIVGTNLVYGRYLEFGTSRMAARPWLLPSFQKATQRVETLLKRELEAKL